MIDLGSFSLVAALCTSLYALFLGAYAAKHNKRTLIFSARNALILSALFSVVSLLVLMQYFVNHEYKYLYIWQHSNNTMPWYYLISAVWGGMDGSMLLWAAILSIFCAAAVIKFKEFNSSLFNWLVPSLSLASSFFLIVVSCFTNPFRLIPGDNIPIDGNGLNPLLQNPSMMIHPPMLYSGFTGFVVPFGFCLAALFSGALDSNWIRFTRKWTLIAWIFLTVGIILGGNWAYIELGWGGFWAWDPVENASFLPWLTATAFLHSTMAQEHKGMLKIWNVSLAILTYMLTVFGTFLTRSGVVQSVHAFAETDIGWIFLVYLFLIFVLSVFLIFKRSSELASDRKIESLISREVVFLLNNLILLGIAFTVFWGVMFPVFSEAVGGEKAVVGPPFFNQVTGPLFIILLFLMLVGPFVSWRQSKISILFKTLWWQFGLGMLTTLLLLYFAPSSYIAAVGIGLSVALIFSIESDFRAASKARRAFANKNESIIASYGASIKRKPRRFGGHIVHLGVAIMAIAIIASSVYKTEKDISLIVGQEIAVDNLKFKLENVEQKNESAYQAISATVSIWQDGKKIKELYPERRAYSKEVTTEVALHITALRDVYIAFAGLEVSNGTDRDLNQIPLIFKVFINPLQVWLWVGSTFVVFGTLVVLLSTERVRELAPDVALRSAI